MSFFYQLDWVKDMAAGRGIANLTGGETADTDTDGANAVLNRTRYPAMQRWYDAMKEYLANLPDLETETTDPSVVLQQMKQYEPPATASLPLPTTAVPHTDLNHQLGLQPGVTVSVAPDDTGRDE